MSRPTLAATVIIALAIGSAGGAAAQEQPGAVAVSTGVVVQDTGVWWEDYGDKVDGPDEDPVRWYGALARSKWVATDPRLSGEATYREMMHRYQEQGFETITAEYTVVNDEGSWTGTNTGYGFKEGEYGGLDVMLLHGAGAYDGLTAFLHAPDWREDKEFRGVIVAGGMPPSPVPAE